MTRTPPSELDQALVAAVAELGFAISAAQLERWRTNLWLARATDCTDPDTGEPRPEAVHRAMCLAAASTPGRGISWLGWTFWAIDDTPASSARLRAAVASALQRPFRRNGVDVHQIPEGDSDAASDAREQLSVALLTGQRHPRKDFDGALRAAAADAAFELPPPRSVPNMFHPALLDQGARMLLGGADDTGFEDLADAWEAASPANSALLDTMRTMNREAALKGIDLFAQSPLADGLRGLVRAVQEADDRVLCAAVRACTKGNAVLSTLLIQRAPDDPAILQTLMDDEMWDQWARVGGFAPVLGVGGEAAIALNVFQYLTLPRWAGDLERYLTLMDTLLAPECRRPGLVAALPTAPRRQQELGVGR
ncbi:hypothetical protein AB0D71_39990 [Streptomyces avermitilis]|uniref:hypothetical protein n=1 Tax=Streptomyces avermitilis TaxID=33903 RepID=UPI0033C095AC